MLLALRHIWGGVLLTVLFAATANAAVNCKLAAPVAAREIVHPYSPDQRLLNQTILAFVNYERCRAGLMPAKLHGGLAKIANNHASWMATNGVLSHRSTLNGQASVQARILASGFKARRGSENIGTLPHFPKDSQLANQFSGCGKIARKAKRQPDQSYVHVAKTIVKMWMKSKPHRKNVLDPGVKVMGSAVSFNSKQTPCGQYYLVQNFAG